MKYKNTQNYQSKTKEYKYSQGEQKLRSELLSEMADLSIMSRRKQFKYAGAVATAGGSATEDFSIPGVRSGMHCGIFIKTVGAIPVTVVSQICDLNKITVVFSADPSNDHVITYMVCA